MNSQQENYNAYLLLIVLILCVTALVIAVVFFLCLVRVEVGKLVVFRKFGYFIKLNGGGNYFVIKYLNEPLRDPQGNMQIFDVKENVLPISVSCERSGFSVTKDIDIFYKITNLKNFEAEVIKKNTNVDELLKGIILPLIEKEVKRWESSKNSWEDFHPEKYVSESKIESHGIEITRCNVKAVTQFANLQKNGVNLNGYTKSAKEVFGI